MIVVDRERYRLEVDGMLATLSSPDGRRWLSLRPLAALDTTEAPDETLEVLEPRETAAGIEIERRSTCWERASVTLACTDDAIEIRTSVAGRGALAAAQLLACRSLIPGAPVGFLVSGTSMRTLFSPNPGDPGRLVRSAAESAVIGVSGDGTPGRGHWFFTPAPLYLALTTSNGVVDPADEVREGWLGLALAAPVDELNFVQLAYRPGDRAFHLELDYEGHTQVDGEFQAPALILTPGVPDPYAGIRRYREDLEARGFVLQKHKAPDPEWWSEPMFCGWGAQCHLAAVAGRPARDFATQESYDRFLEHLEEQGVVPGTVVIDDKWQDGYGTNAPDRGKWPDLKAWIAERRERGQHVLLWWKAWDAEGLPADLCIRDPDGRPVALDPGNPAARDALRESVTQMLSPDGIDADGLKIDFTARTPSGRALTSSGPRWGIALLHELLSVVYTAAKEAKPDALLITQTPNPSFVDVTDMIRLNDMLRMDDPGPMPPVLPQMLYRARVARSACPELPIDTDDWPVPDRETWRAYLELKPELGVPALYYAGHLDVTGEPFTPDDYDALRRVWATWTTSRV